VELYLHSPIRLLGVVLRKHSDNFTFTFNDVVLRTDFQYYLSLVLRFYMKRIHAPGDVPLPAI